MLAGIWHCEGSVWANTMRCTSPGCLPTERLRSGRADTAFVAEFPDVCSVFLAGRRGLCAGSLRCTGPDRGFTR